MVLVKDTKKEEVEPLVPSASADAPKTEDVTPTETIEKKPEVTQLPLGPYEPNTPVGKIQIFINKCINISIHFKVIFIQRE